MRATLIEGEGQQSAPGRALPLGKSSCPRGDELPCVFYDEILAWIIEL